MTFFPNREVFLSIGNIDVRWYAVCIMTGALITTYLSQWDGKKRKYDADIYDDLFIGIMSIGTIGCRIWYVLFYDLETYLANPISILRIWDGGLAIQGGLIFGLAFGYVYCTIKRYSFLRIVDTIMPNVLIAQACGRWGNFVNQECYGQVVDEEFYNGILSFIKDDMFIGGKYREPMFFFESVLCVVGFILIRIYMKTAKARRGDGLYCYLSWYGAIRFWIESRRTDSLMLGNIKVAQLISIIFLVIGMLGLLGVYRKIFKKQKPAVVFDLDCTLVDTYSSIIKSFEHVFSKYAPDYQLTEKEKADLCGPTLKETFEKYFPGRDDYDDMIDMYRQYNVTHHAELVKAYPNAKELLQFLKDKGYRIAIASSKISSTIKLSLEICGLDGYFDDQEIIGCEKAQLHKPDPEGIMKALKELNASKDNAIYIGDSVADIQAAKNAGVYAISYCTNEYKRDGLVVEKPNRSIEDLIELVDILQEDITWTYDMM